MMIRTRFFLALIIFCLSLLDFNFIYASTSKNILNSSKSEFSEKLSHVSIPFIPNHGQTAKEVKFYAKTFIGTVFVTEYGQIVYVINSNDKKIILNEELSSIKPENITAQDKSDTMVGYFSGSDSSSHLTDIVTYNTLSLGEIYKGIELKLRAHGNNVEKLFYVSPYANPKSIKIALNNAESIKIDKNGALMVKTPNGYLSFTKPVAYQEKNGKKVYVPVKYKIVKDLKDESKFYSFNLGSYDRSKPLVIDPLLQSTFAGGESDEEASAIAINQTTGDIYVTGYTTSVNFPGLGSGADVVLAGTKNEVFVSRFNHDLTQLLQSTYLGGSGDDEGNSIEINHTTGDIYVAGFTTSTDFPYICGAVDVVFAGNSEAFVSHLSSDLKTLYQTTYLGGSYDDKANSIAINQSTGDVYVTGDTTSVDFPGTKGGAQNIALGLTEGFVSRLSSNLFVLYQSTYIGGSNNDEAHGIAINQTTGDVYVAGWTASSNLPVITGGADSTFAGISEGFVTRFGSDLTTLFQSTYIGGKNEDKSLAVAVKNSSGEVYVTGYTYSSDFPGTSGAPDTTYENIEAFVSKFASDLKSLKISTYLGGSNYDYGYGIAVNQSTGDVYVSGVTQSSDFPKISSGADTVFAGTSEAFVARLSFDFKSLYQSSYLGGANEDKGYAIAIKEPEANVYVAGGTNSSDFPVISGGGDVSFIGNSEAFISFLSSDLLLIAPVYTLTVTKAVSGAGNGTIVATGCALTWSTSTTGTCQANTTRSITLSGVPSGSSVWGGWSKGAGSASSCAGTSDCIFNMGANSSVTGTFNAPPTQYKLTVNKAGTGTGDISATGCTLVWTGNTGVCTVNSGTSITISGSPSAGSNWTGWSGATGSASTCSGTTGNCSFNISAATNITGTFNISTKTQYTLTVNKAGTGTGNITSTGCNLSWTGTTGSCFADKGTSIKLSGSATNGSAWTGWTSGTGSAANCAGVSDCTFDLNATSQVTGIFNPPATQYTLVVTKSGTGTGNIDATGCSLSWTGNTGECAANAGTSITLSGAGIGGSMWNGWSCGVGSAVSCTGTGNCSFSLNAESRVTGVFYNNQSCAYSISPSANTYSFAATTGSINVIPSSINCSWSATSLADWITITSGATGVGNGTVSFSVSQNSGTSTRAGTIVVGDQSFTVTQTGFESIALKLVACDLNGDGLDDILKLDAGGAILYSYYMIYFTQIPGNVTKDIACGDLNGNGRNDIIGLNSDGSIKYTLNLGANWQNITGAMSKVFVSDINGDGKDDILGLSASGNIFATYNLNTWNNLPGILQEIKPGNFNTLRAGNEISGLNASGYIYYTNDLNSWVNIPGSLSKVFMGDVNNDGKIDVLGLNSKNEIYYTTNLANWTNIPGSLIDIVTGDVNGDGKKDVIGNNASNEIYYTTNLSIWSKIPGQYSKLITADFNGDGKADIAGIDTEGKVYFTTNLNTWILIE